MYDDFGYTKQKKEDMFIEDKEFMKKTYDRIVEKLDGKASPKVQVKKLNRNNKAIAA